MEQINAGILKLMNISANSLVNGSKVDFSANRETTFDALLEQKNNQARSEVVSDKKRKPSSSEKESDTVQVEEKTDLPKEKVEEENCDVAREAAAAQMVWMMAPNSAAEWKVPEQMENVATIEEPILITVSDEPVSELGEEILAQLAAAGTANAQLQPEEFENMIEQQLAPEQMPEPVAAEELMQQEANIGGQAAEDTAPEIEVTGDDGDEINVEGGQIETALFKDVEAAPVKVAEAPARAESSEPVEKQVGDKLTSLLESGETKVEIQLTPVELGKMTIELVQNTDGTMHIRLNAESVETRALLERHVNDLYEALNERGQQNVQITVERNQESQRQDPQQSNDFRDGSNGQQQEQQQQRREPRSGEDFLQQLRLGLIPIEDEEEDN